MSNNKNSLSITKLTAIVTLFVTIGALVSSAYGFYNWMLSVGDKRWAKIEIVQTVYANTEKITLQELYRQRTQSRNTIFDILERIKLNPDDSKLKADLEEQKMMLSGINEDIRRLELENKK